ncbi:MAG: autotransporter domain-containing protein, partial [Proteobacteria bacterium]|nr:autotransporter domain-containing protein [Pseudomonadota bacterium]
TVNGVMGPVNGLKSLNILGGPGTLVTFNNNILHNTPIWYFNDGTVSIADGKTISDVENQTGMVTGTLIFQGGGTVNNIAGPTPLTPLTLVTVNANGGVKTLNFTGQNINANTINVVGGGGNATTLNFNSATGTNQSGNITTNNNGLDIITLNSTGSSVFDGQVGTATNHFAALDLLQPGATLKVIGNIYANQIQLNAANTTLQIEDGSPFGPITTNVPNQGTVTFLGNSTVDFAVGTVGNPISAFNVNGFAGSVVSLNASVFADTFSVNNGGTLRPINGDTVTATPVDINNGILQITNNSIFNVNGDLNINNANAILQVDMGHNLTSTGEVFVTGTASVKAPASLSILNPAFSPNGPTVIPIVMAGVGDFAPAMNITNPNSFLTTFSTSVTNGGNTLNLIITSKALANVADQPNTIGVGGLLDELASSGVPVTGSLENIIEQLNSFDSAEEVNFALSTLAPIVDGAILNESFMAQREIFDAIGLRFDRMRFWTKHHGQSNTGLSGGDAGDENSGWVKVLRQHANQKEREGVEGYHEDMLGLVVGGDTLVRDDIMLGAALSWTNLDMHDKIVNRNKTTVNSYQATVYASLECNTPWFFDGYAALAYNDYIVHRNIVFGNVDLFPRGEFKGWQAGAKGEAGYIFDFGSLHIVPIASLFYSHLNLDAYQETGADTANLVIAGSDFDALLGGVGVQLVDEYAYDSQRLFQAQAHMMVYYDFVGDRMQLSSQFVGAGPSFNTLGFTPAQTSFNIGGHVSLFSTHDWIFTVSYDFDVKEDYTANAGFLRVKHEW